MTRRTSLRAAFAVGLALLLAPAGARADDAEGLRGPRLAVVPAIGVGIGGFTSPPSFAPGFIGMSVAQVELSYETERWGGFGRVGFLSSGNDGRWTAPVVALGASYRLQGDGEARWGLVPRLGLVYQRWHANSAGCPLPLIIPGNCKDFTPSVPNGSVAAPVPAQFATVDTLGLLAGIRAEAPVGTSFFVAFGAEVSGTVDVSQSSPGTAWTGQLTLALGLRNHQVGNAPMRRPRDPTRHWTRDQGL